MDRAVRYKMVFMPNHPNANKYGWVPEHVVAMAIMIGRSVPKGMVVHHMDGDKRNNAPSNLMLCTQRDHTRMHVMMRAVERCGDGWKRPCRFCGEYSMISDMVKHGKIEGWCHFRCRQLSWAARKDRYVRASVGGRRVRTLRPGLTDARRRK